MPAAAACAIICRSMVQIPASINTFSLIPTRCPRRPNARPLLHVGQQPEQHLALQTACGGGTTPRAPNRLACRLKDVVGEASSQEVLIEARKFNGILIEAEHPQVFEENVRCHRSHIFLQRRLSTCSCSYLPNVVCHTKHFVDHWMIEIVVLVHRRD